MPLPFGGWGELGLTVPFFFLAGLNCISCCKSVNFTQPLYIVLQNGGIIFMSQACSEFEMRPGDEYTLLNAV